MHAARAGISQADLSCLICAYGVRAPCSLSLDNSYPAQKMLPLYFVRPRHINHKEEKIVSVNSIARDLFCGFRSQVFRGSGDLGGIEGMESKVVTRSHQG